MNIQKYIDHLGLNDLYITDNEGRLLKKSLPGLYEIVIGDPLRELYTRWRLQLDEWPDYREVKVFKGGLHVGESGHIRDYREPEVLLDALCKDVSLQLFDKPMGLAALVKHTNTLNQPPIKKWSKHYNGINVSDGVVEELFSHGGQVSKAMSQIAKYHGWGLGIHGDEHRLSLGRYRLMGKDKLIYGSDEPDLDELLEAVNAYLEEQ